jgi:hypothetical protein
MKTIHAIYENGVFRPTEPVDLPEGSEVTIEPKPRSFEDRQPQPDDPEFAHLDPGQRRIYSLLAHRYDGGAPDAAARHDEHQP